MRLSSLLLLITFTFWADAVLAAPYRRLVNFEWEAIEGADSYEVELKPVTEIETNKIFSFKTKEAAWNGKLSAGKYIMKLRSRDKRGVPGDWSEPSEFNVGLENAILRYPAQESQIPAKEIDETKISFKWDPVGGADGYLFELQSEDEKIKVSQKIETPQFEMKIPVAAKYTWKVTAMNKDGFQSEATTVAQFSLLGPALTAPVIEKPENDFVREIKWTHTDSAPIYDVVLSKLNPIAKKWETVKSVESTQDNSLVFDSNLPGGRYQVAVRTKGTLRPSSPMARQSFKVRDGDRSPASEYTAMVRKSIERVEGWYAIASYLITEMQFKGSNPENNSAVAYSAVGGTGRLGAGWFNPKNPWGFLGIVDMSGFTFNGKTQTFASAEFDSVYRKSFDDRSEIRLQSGLYYKELPETIGDPFSQTSNDLKITSAGPHLGAEYWYSMTPKLGLQANAHIYVSMFKISTPNGQELSPTFSTQFGFLGSYRFTKDFTGLVGYARREEKMSYKAVPSASNFATAGDVNESTISGNYLNFFAEWAF